MKVFLPLYLTGHMYGYIGQIFYGVKDNFLQPSQYKYFTETGKIWPTFHSSFTCNFFKFLNSLQLFLIIYFMLKSIAFMRGAEYLTKVLKMLNGVVKI